MKEVIAMTDEQARRADIEARIDELDRLSDVTEDGKVLEYIKARKKELRMKIDALS